MEQLQKLTVSEITSIIKTTLEESFFGLTVEGEISNFKKASNGHWYFNLKDETAIIRAVVWRSGTASVGFVPVDGMKVVVTGNLTVYPASGNYQINVFSIKQSGLGDILSMLEQRKKHYLELGYFDPEKKKPIPKNPSKVAVITSPTGAALQDILQITGRRNPSMNIIILPAQVQGSDAAHTIACRINQVNLYSLADVMIVGRGGGSIEDLLPFSEDEVIQAIHNSEIPVISAVGHEVDWAISDFAADLRAPTPSAAAELVCERTQDKKEKLKTLVSSMEDSINKTIEKSRLKASVFSCKSAKAHVQNKLFNVRMTLDTSITLLKNNLDSKTELLRSRLENSVQTLNALSPVSVLSRGYAIVTSEDGKTVTDSRQVCNGDKLKIKLKSNGISAVVTEE